MSRGCVEDRDRAGRAEETSEAFPVAALPVSTTEELAVATETGFIRTCASRYPVLDQAANHSLFLCSSLAPGSLANSSGPQLASRHRKRWLRMMPCATTTIDKFASGSAPARDTAGLRCSATNRWQRACMASWLSCGTNCPADEEDGCAVADEARLEKRTPSSEPKFFSLSSAN